MKTHLAVDIAVLRLNDDKLEILLMKRDSNSTAYPNQWALPGGVVDENDINLENAAHRTLTRRIGSDVTYLEQVWTEANATRDFRGWSSTTLYFALIPFGVELKLNDQSKWFSLQDPQLKSLAFDHSYLVEKAVQRFQTKAVYSLLPAYLMPEQFTYTELQTVYENILNKKIDKSQLREKLKNHPDLIICGKKTGVPYKPPVLLKVATKPTQLLFPEPLIKM